MKVKSCVSVTRSGLAESLAVLAIQLCAGEIVAKACIKALADVLLRLSQEGARWQ